MTYNVYRFPTVEDGINAVEQKLCELLAKYREDRSSLDPIELDYMDWANTVVTELG